MSTAADLDRATRKRRTSASPIFSNVVCHRCGASGVLDSRECPRCDGSGFTRGPQHHGVALNLLSAPERNLREARRNSLNNERPAATDIARAA